MECIYIIYTTNHLKLGTEKNIADIKKSNRNGYSIKICQNLWCPYSCLKDVKINNTHCDKI